MAALEHVAKFTYDDYRTAPEDRRHELLDRDLVVAPAPNLKHRRVLLALAGLMDRFVKESGGETLRSPTLRGFEANPGDIFSTG